MRDINSFIKNCLSKKEKHKKQLAAIISLSMLISFAVPMLLTEPAISQTQDDMLNDTYFNYDNIQVLSANDHMISNVAGTDGNGGVSPAQLSEYALIIGEPVNGTEIREWLQGCETASQVIEAAKRTYFLGIASDFCLFLKNDFTPTNSDAEGRVVVGGNVNFTKATKDWQYMIGNGDYEKNEDLTKLSYYKGLQNFAHLITDGTITNISLLWQDKSGECYGDDQYKRFVVNGDIDSCTHKADGTLYQQGCKHSKTIDELSCIYQGNIMNIQQEYAYVEAQSAKLSRVNMTSGATAVWTPDNTVVFNPQWEQANFTGYKLTCTAPEGCTDETVYFKIDDWHELTEVEFVNIPYLNDAHTKIANIVINCGADNIVIDSTNLAGNLDETTNIVTKINGVTISKPYPHGVSASDDDPEKDKGSHNNHIWSENILYNFPNATDLTIDANFNGTLLAPKADAHSLLGDDGEPREGGRGHLSGSLIAKSYKGGSEFGYRPYRGTVDILGSTNGYTIPFDKFITGTSNRLGGANFGVYEGNTLVTSFTSNDTETSFVNLPSKVIFDDDQKEQNITQSATYTIKEDSAPTGFLLDSKEYTVTINETVKATKDKQNLVGKTTFTGIPTEVEATVTITGPENYSQTLNIKLEDIWTFDTAKSQEQIIRRVITVGTDVFNLDMQDGKIVQVTPNSGDVLESTEIFYADGVTATSNGTKIITTTVPVTEVKTEYVMTMIETEVTDDEGNIVTTDDGEPVMTQTEVTTLDEDGNPITQTVTADGEPVMEVVTTQISEVIGGDTYINNPENFDGKCLLQIFCNGYSASSHGKYTVRFHYKDGTITEVTDNKATTESGTDDKGNYYSNTHLDISTDVLNIEKEIIAVEVGFENDFNASAFVIQENGNNWDAVFGSAWGAMEFKAGETKLFASNVENIKASTATNTTAISTSYSTVTTEIDTDISTVYVTTSLSKKVINKYRPISEINADSATTYTTTSDYGLSGKTYRYVPDSMMMMPLPDTYPSFENKVGLLFEKIDSSTGTGLTGANIKLYKGTTEITSDIWQWDSAKSSYLIDMDKLDTGVEYHFHEAEKLEGYELAKDIYFKVNNDKSVEYWQDEDEEHKSSPVGDEKYPYIEMIDIKETGAKIKLAKYAYENNAINENKPLSATFKLYASDGTTLIYPVRDAPAFEIKANEEFDLYAVLKNAGKGTYNEEYVENGYLKKGKIYVLKEDTAPDGYVKQDSFSFKVESDNSITVIPSGTPAYLDKVSITGNGDVWVKPTDESGSLTSIQNVTKIEIELQDLSSGDKVKVYDLGSSNTQSNFSKVITGEKLSSCDDGWGVEATLSENLLITLEFSEAITFDQLKLNKSGLSASNVKQVRIYSEAGSGGSGDSGNGVTITNDKIKIEGTALKVAKENPDKPFISYDIMNAESWAGGQIKVNDVYTSNNLYKLENSDNTYTLNEIAELSGTSINDMNDVLFATWGLTFSNVQFLLSASEPEPDPTPTDPDPTPTDPSEPLDLVVGTSAGGVSLIKIPNRPSDSDTININVKKQYKNDEGYESIRPEVTVTLKRKLKDQADYDTTFTGENYTVVLNEANNWTHSWSGLDKHLAGDETQIYTYYIVETAVNGYDSNATEENPLQVGSGGGDITVENTLKTKEITINKNWLKKDVPNSDIPAKPDSIKVNLSYKVGTKTYNKKLTITPGVLNVWNITYPIPDSATNISITEDSVYGWKFLSVYQMTNNSYQISNEPDLASLNIEKQWQNDTETDRPDEINFKLYRDTIIKQTAFDVNSVLTYPDYESNAYASKDINKYNDYARLLQYSLYFYDANMCGSDVTDASAYDWRKNCHEYVTAGGYHDAGDHSMLGITQGFTASTLGWSYYEFKDAYDSNGLTDHYQQIMKRFCDFFVKSIKEENGTTKILVQKGDVANEHSHWESPETQVADNFGKEHWVSNGEGADVAASYAAALAQYAKNFPEDADSNMYLNTAEKFYSYSMASNAKALSDYGNDSSGNRIYPDSNLAGTQAWAAAWMYLANPDNSQYKTECKNKLAEITDNRGYFWGDMMLGAATVYAKHIDTKDTAVNNIVSGYLNKIGLNTSDNNFKVLDSWGSARHNTLLQLVLLAYDKDTYKDWCQNQMKKILGDNSKDVCLVVGYADNSATSPHHRAASNHTEDSSWTYWNNHTAGIKFADLEGSHTLIGALVGGPTASDFSSYNDDMKDATSNEVALDYNAGLVAAAAGLYDAFGTGLVYSNIQVEPEEEENGNTGGTTSNPSGSDTTEVVDTTDMTFVKNIKITPNNSKEWKATVNNLPKTDADGNEYAYYIVEVDKTDKVIADNNVLEGNNCKYIPVSYEGNGLNLNTAGQNDKIVVTNKLTEKNQGVSMPSTGGSGTNNYHVVGMCLMGMAGILLIIRRKKRNA